VCSKLDPHEKIALLERVAEIFISDPAEHIELFEDGTAKGVKLDALKIDIHSLKIPNVDAILHRGLYSSLLASVVLVFMWSF
jgi:hypothetical protein